MSVLTRHNGFACLDCGSDQMGMVCSGCGVMVCACKGCDCALEREKEKEEREAVVLRRSEMHEEIESGYWD